MASFVGIFQVHLESPHLKEIFATEAVAPEEDDFNCGWQPGGINKPLERLMFGESPSQEALASQMLCELLDTPPDGAFAPEVPSKEDVKRSLFSDAVPSARKEKNGFPNPGMSDRLAIWYVEEVTCGREAALYRLDNDDEAFLNKSLASLIRSLERRRVSPSTANGAAQFLSEFASAVGRHDVTLLRCVPLDGDLSRKLPQRLKGDARICTLKLPARKRTSSGMLAGATLQHAKGVVGELLDHLGPAVFKIGITATPLARWRYYEKEGYQQFHLLHVAEEATTVQMLEAALIDAFKDRPGCRNIARGGEGPTGRGPHWTYIAVVACGDGVGILQKKRPRRHLDLYHG